MTPPCVKSYVKAGHHVTIQRGAGHEAGFDDEEYLKAGALLAESAAEIWNSSEMIVKVKEPLPEEYSFFRRDLILFTYLHLAADQTLTDALLKAGVNSVAYETIQTSGGTLPCLRPMSEIAGRLSAQEGAKYLEKPFGGRGVLLGGVPGVPRGKVAILGGGVVGTHAAKMCFGLGAEVTILDVNMDRLNYLDDIFSGQITTLYSSEANREKIFRESDLIIGAVLIPGAKAPKLVRREDLKMMKKGAVLVDVAVDQGGCFETTRATYHDNPVYITEDVVHYCVANMPGAVARTSTLALTTSTLPYGLLLADKGLTGALKISEPLRHGLNTYRGHCTFRGVAEAFNLPYTPPEDLNG